MSLLTGDAVNVRKLIAGVGSPEGVLAANVGTFYIDNSTGTIYTKTSGAGDTGWTAVGGGGAITSPLIVSSVRTYAAVVPSLANNTRIAMNVIFPDLVGQQWGGFVTLQAPGTWAFLKCFSSYNNMLKDYGGTLFSYSANNPNTLNYYNDTNVMYIQNELGIPFDIGVTLEMAMGIY